MKSLLTGAGFDWVLWCKPLALVCNTDDIHMCVALKVYYLPQKSDQMQLLLSLRNKDTIAEDADTHIMDVL